MTLPFVIVICVESEEEENALWAVLFSWLALIIFRNVFLSRFKKLQHGTIQITGLYGMYCVRFHTDAWFNLHGW